MRVTAHNRGPEAATLHLLPTLWFRNTWSWGDDAPKPSLSARRGVPGVSAATASHAELGEWLLQADGNAQLLFCENETNNERLFGCDKRSPYVKDAINDFVVAGPHGRGQPGAQRHKGRRPSRAADRSRRERVDRDAAERRRPRRRRRGVEGAGGRRRPWIGARLKEAEADVLRDADPADARMPTPRW